MNTPNTESPNVAQIEADFTAKYGIDHTVPSSLDYLKLLALAGEVNQTEEWVAEQLGAYGAAAIRQEDGSVFMVGITWALLREIHSQLYKMKDDNTRAAVAEMCANQLSEAMLNAEKVKLKKWAAEQGLNDTQIQEAWSNAFWSEKTMVSSVTPKRLETFRSELLKKIKEIRDDESGSNIGDMSRGGSSLNDVDNNDAASQDEARPEANQQAGQGSDAGGRAEQSDEPSGSAAVHPAAEQADTSEPLQMDEEQFLEFNGFLAELSEEEWLKIDKIETYYHEMLNGEEFVPAEWDNYLMRCWLTRTPFYPGYVYPDAPPVKPEKISEDGEVRVDGLLLSLGLTEFPTLDHPNIEEIINEVGRRIALDKAEVEMRRAACEIKCKQLLKHAEGYELAFGALMAEHAAKQLKRSKKTGKIYGSKTVPYETFTISFEKSGGMWVSRKADLDKHFLADEEARKLFNVRIDTVPKYENKVVIDTLIKLGQKKQELTQQVENLKVMVEKDASLKVDLEKVLAELKALPAVELPGVVDAPVNETAKWTINPAKEK